MNSILGTVSRYYSAMRNVITLICLFFMGNMLFATQTVEDEFAKANKLYQQEKYSEALTIYKQIEAQELQSDDLFYNMANAFYKMNQVAPAIYYFEKALKINPDFSNASAEMGECLLKIGKFEEGRSLIQKSDGSISL